MVSDTSTENAQGSSPAAEGDKIRFHYIKSPQFRTVHVDGVHGGLTPQGKVQMALYSERLPIPRETVQYLKEDGSLGDEILEERVARVGVVREIESNLVMDIEQARSVARWLMEKVEQFEKMTQASSAGDKNA